MATQTYPTQTRIFFIDSRLDLASRRLGWTVAVSLLLHLCVLAFVAGVRFTHTGERPLTAVQVTLVSLPVLPKPATESASRPTPAPVAAHPAPVPTPVPVPAAPASRSEAQGVKRASGDVMRDVLRGIELPPDAPQFGDISPSKPIAEPQRQVTTKTERSAEKLQRDLDSLLGKLKVPELRMTTDAPVEQAKPAKPVATAPDRSSFSEEVDRELEKELKKLQSPPPVRKIPELVKETKPQAQEVPSRPVPPVAAKVPNAKIPDTMLKAPGSSSGSNQYLARVQAIISSKWTAPPVNVSGQRLTVVIRFRLDRSGKVSGVTVERSSGNDYYDLAGQRAVLYANPLPVFPPEMADSSLDAHFTFSVGEQQAG